MAAEREPPPLGDVKPTDFEELEDGEDLFTSTVSTLEVRRPLPRRPRRASRRLSPAATCPLPTPRFGQARSGDTCDAGRTSGACQGGWVGPGGQASGLQPAGLGCDFILPGPGPADGTPCLRALGPCGSFAPLPPGRRKAWTRFLGTSSPLGFQQPRGEGLVSVPRRVCPARGP